MATNTRNMLYYNGVWMDIVKLQRMTMTPQYSGMNYIHTRVDLRVRGLITSETNFEYIKLKYAAGSEAFPYTVSQVGYGGNVNKALLSDVRIVGDARNADAILVNSALSSTPVNGLSAIRHHLLQPRGILLYFMNDDLVLGCPQYPYTAISTDGPLYRSMDAKGGPLPVQASVDQLTPNSIGIDFTITCFINEAQKYQAAWQYKYIESHSYYVDVDVDAFSMEVRTTVGVVNFRADLLKANEVHPDDFREFFAPIVPAGFKREHFGVKISPDHSALQYRAVDREKHYMIERETGANDCWVGSPIGFEKGTIDRSKVTEIQCVQTRSQTLKGADSTLASLVGAGGKLMKGDIGGAAGQVLGNLWQVPQSTHSVSIKVFGSSLASTYELERVAFYMMLVRLPYYIVGTSGYRWELRADKVGGYVELDVVKTSASQWGIGDISFYQLNDDIKDDCALTSNDRQLLGAVNVAGNVVPGGLFNIKSDLGYFPTNNYMTHTGSQLITSFTGPEHTKHITVSSAVDTYRFADDDPFAQSSWVELQNRISSTEGFVTFESNFPYWNRSGVIGAQTDSANVYIHEINPGMYQMPAMYFANLSRSHGVAATSAIVHTNALVDIANDIGVVGGGDTFAIKRVNTDYRYRPGNTDNLNAFPATVLRNNLDAYGTAPPYLTNPPVIFPTFAEFPVAPYSYAYQAGA